MAQPNRAEYRSTPPALTDGESSYFQLDQNGNLKVSVASGGGGSETVTPNFRQLIDSDNVTIPAGAKGWTVTVISGQADFNSSTVTLPAGFSDSDDKTLASSILVTSGGSGSNVYVRWNT